MVTIFDSVGEFVKANPSPTSLLKDGRTVEQYKIDNFLMSSYKLNWYGGLSFDAAMAKAERGDDSLVSAAMAQLEQFDVALPTTNWNEVIRAPFGARVNTGDWLAGSPTPCRRRVKRTSDIGPIKIVVSLTSSGAISPETMQERGITILAFLMKVQQYRPVDLYGLIESGGVIDDTYAMIHIESRPLNISQAAFVLTNVGFARHGYHYGIPTNGYNGVWPTGYNSSNYDTIQRERLGLEPTDIVIKAAYLHDELLRNPIAWMTEQLSKITEVNEEREG